MIAPIPVVRRPRQGVAIVIALFFSFCLMILFVGMLFQQRNTASHNRISLQERQAFFAARSAIQHFLLKSKLFPTELYDAVEFKQGKNPLCDFSEFPAQENGKQLFAPVPGEAGVYRRVFPTEELDMRNKTKYFYLKLPLQEEMYIRLGSYYNPDYRFLAPALAESNAAQRYTKPKPLPASFNGGKFLDYYIKDCSNTNGEQPALETIIGTDVKNARSWKLSSRGHPYTMQYLVEAVKIHAMKGLRRYNEEAIEISVVGKIFDFQGKPFNQVQKKIMKITRRGAL